MSFRAGKWTGSRFVPEGAGERLVDIGGEDRIGAAMDPVLVVLAPLGVARKP